MTQQPNMKDALARLAHEAARLLMHMQPANASNHWKQEANATATALYRVFGEPPREATSAGGNYFDMALASQAKAPAADLNVEAVRQSLLDRSRVGIAKYGVTTERTDLAFNDWLNHLQEELLDATVYIQAAKAANVAPPANLLKVGGKLEATLAERDKRIAELGRQAVDDQRAYITAQNLTRAERDTARAELAAMRKRVRRGLELAVENYVRGHKDVVIIHLSGLLHSEDILAALGGES